MTICAAVRKVRSARTAPSRVAEARPQAGVITVCAASSSGSTIEITEPSEHPSGQLIGAERTVGGQRTQAYPLPSFEAESDFIPIRIGQLVDVDQQPGKAG